MPLQYDTDASRYRASNGQFVSAKTIRDEIEKSIIERQREIKQLSQKLVDGKINLSKWTTEMRDQIKHSHLVSAAVARGGREQLTQSDLGRLGAKLKEQYKYLNSFARDIANGKVNPSAIASRAASYMTAARALFYAEEQAAKAEGDFTKAKRVLRSGESCAGCIAQAARGFIAIEEMPPIGSIANCFQRCRCVVEYL